MSTQGKTMEEKLAAVYALNMCTVSVSQIVDYHDSYILEQEYDAILNNLDLKAMPKDKEDALLKILVELLNTITFFRIQDIKKKQIEEAYCKRVKDAIWSAIPSLSVFVSGSPIAIALTLASQIGTGYMNYRKEKANALSGKEDAEVELQIAAIEQINALRRELFTTAWRLAAEYGYDDSLRLTENQITQYNQILMDQDDYRRYARLDAISNKFNAYPPFWYFFAHTALSIVSSSTDSCIKEDYQRKAKEHFKKFEDLSKYNILREDQITASACLEYAELLLLEEEPNYSNISNLIHTAEEKSGNRPDVIQLCAIYYLRCGESGSEKASKLLKYLINENYNAVSNAKILSRLYVNKFIKTNDDGDNGTLDKETADRIMNETLSDYTILENRVDSIYLFPMPKNCESIKMLEDNYEQLQKRILENKYRNSINAFARKEACKYNSIIPSACMAAEEDNYYVDSEEARNQRLLDMQKILESNNANYYIERLRNCGIAYGIINCLNETVTEFESLTCFKQLENHDNLIKTIEAHLRSSKNGLVTIQNKLDNGTFDINDYRRLIKEYSYQSFTREFYNNVKDKICDYIKAVKTTEKIEQYTSELDAFCLKNGLESPESFLYAYKPKNLTSQRRENVFFPNQLLGVSDQDKKDEEMASRLLEMVSKNAKMLVQDEKKVRVLLKNQDGFDSYFCNTALQGNIYLTKQMAVAVIDDLTKKDLDLVLGSRGVTCIKKNVIRETIPYADITHSTSGERCWLDLGCYDDYNCLYLNMDKLVEIIDRIKSNDCY